MLATESGAPTRPEAASGAPRAFPRRTDCASRSAGAISHRARRPIVGRAQRLAMNLAAKGALAPTSGGLGESTVQAQGPWAVGHQQRQTAGNGYVLEEHDRLDLIGEIVVKQYTGQQREAGEQKGGDTRLPADDQGDRAQDFGGDDDGQQGCRDAEGSHVRGGPAVGTDLAETGDQEKHGQQDAAAELGSVPERGLVPIPARTGGNGGQGVARGGG